jgi:hypothetical protein
MTVGAAFALLLAGGACDTEPKNVGDESDGQACTPGQEMPADDDCNTCVCTEEGAWACTDKVCQGGTTEGTTGDTTEGTTGDTTEGTTGDTTEGTTGDTTEGTTGDTTEGSTSGGTATEGTTGDVDPGFDPSDKGVQMCGEPLSQEAYDIIDPGPQIELDTLLLNVGYSGCDAHQFGLCWDNAFLESDPVQVNVIIPHYGNDDCDAYLGEGLSFDLTDLKTAWQEAYQQEHGVIFINLEGWEQSIEYVF